MGESVHGRTGISFAVPLEGTNESMVTEYIKVCLIPAIIALLLVITGMFFLRKKEESISHFCMQLSWNIILHGRSDAVSSMG